MKLIKNWKTRTWILGALLGGLAGTMAAFIIIQQAEKKNGQRMPPGLKSAVIL